MSVEPKSAGEMKARKHACKYGVWKSRNWSWIKGTWCRILSMNSSGYQPGAIPWYVVDHLSCEFPGLKSQDHISGSLYSYGSLVSEFILPFLLDSWDSSMMKWFEEMKWGTTQHLSYISKLNLSLLEILSRCSALKLQSQQKDCHKFTVNLGYNDWCGLRWVIECYSFLKTIRVKLCKAINNK